MISNYTHESGFYWGSTLSPEEKQEIIEWVKSLGEREQALLGKILHDTRLDVEFDCRED